jgi:hypothetical protein
MRSIQWWSEAVVEGSAIIGEAVTVDVLTQGLASACGETEHGHQQM